MKSFLEKISPHLTTFFSWILGIVFLLAGFSKTNDPTTFYNELQKISFLNQWQVSLLVFLLPGLEILLGICFIFRVYPKETSLISTVLLSVFLVYALFNSGETAKGCGCIKLAVPIWFEMKGWKVIVRDFVLLNMSLHRLYFFKSSLKN